MKDGSHTFSKKRKVKKRGKKKKESSWPPKLVAFIRNIEVEIWNNLRTVTVSSSFWAKSSELLEHMVIFALTTEKLKIDSRKTIK